MVHPQLKQKSAVEIVPTLSCPISPSISFTTPLLPIFQRAWSLMHALIPQHYIPSISSYPSPHTPPYPSSTLHLLSYHPSYTFVSNPYPFFPIFILTASCPYLLHSFSIHFFSVIPSVWILHAWLPNLFPTPSLEIHWSPSSLYAINNTHTHNPNISTAMHHLSYLVQQ